MRTLNLQSGSVAHFVAAACALAYAWQISNSIYVQTGLQFIAPLIIIILVHLIWIYFTTHLNSGFSSELYKRSAQTAAVMALMVIGYSIVAPMPSEASSGIGEQILVVLFCLAILAAVVAVLALGIKLFFKMILAIRDGIKKDMNDGNDTKLFDFGSVAITLMFLSVSSLEGLPNSFAFDASNRATASKYIDARPETVWATMQIATSPEIPLPQLLSLFPQPVEVSVDEGTQLGANRKVRISGREGDGYLTLQVTERTDTRAEFKVLSDTSPFAGWLNFQKLVYEVTPQGEGTKLDVSLEYERLLSPAWFFNTAMSGAAYLAMDVLASDVQSRTEAPDA